MDVIFFTALEDHRSLAQCQPSHLMPSSSTKHRPKAGRSRGVEQADSGKKATELFKEFQERSPSGMKEMKYWSALSLRS